jgi:phosphoribosylanthranilate isomerase
MKIKVKICCISSHQEAQMAIEQGATALGLVGPMPSGPGIIDDELIADIASKTPSHIETFLLTSETSAVEIIKHHQKVNTTTIQIVDKLVEGHYEDIREHCPKVKLVQVIHILDESSIDEAIEASKHVDFILLDSGNPHQEIKTLGGTGNTHNWDISQTIRKNINVPLYLAGGLNPQNVQQAIETVKPYGLDLCSGVRTDNKLDQNKLESFFQNIQG